MAGAARVRVVAFTAHGGCGEDDSRQSLARQMQCRRLARGGVCLWLEFLQPGRPRPTSLGRCLHRRRPALVRRPRSRRCSPWDKGELLARRPSPGAYPAGAGRPRAAPVRTGLERGKLRDPAVDTLLRGLARQLGGSAPHHHARAAVGFRRARGRDRARPRQRDTDGARLLPAGCNARRSGMVGTDAGAARGWPRGPGTRPGPHPARRLPL